LSKLIGQGWSPENEPERGEWFWKDVQRMADWCGGEAKGVQPVLVDVIDRESGCVSWRLSRRLSRRWTIGFFP
jgi:surfeit locus 1 family protein